MGRHFDGNPYIWKLPSAVYQRLRDCLDRNRAWERLLENVSNNYSQNLYDIINRERKKNSLTEAEILLTHLGSKNVRAARLANWLEKANLQNALMLLKDSEPLNIYKVPPSRVSVIDGFYLKLSCKAKAFPKPEYSWFKDGVELLLHQEPDLVIDPVRPKDAGMYKCRIYTPYESYETKSCCVSVVPPLHHVWEEDAMCEPQGNEFSDDITVITDTECDSCSTSSNGFENSQESFSTDSEDTLYDMLVQMNVNENVPVSCGSSANNLDEFGLKLKCMRKEFQQLRTELCSCQKPGHQLDNLNESKQYTAGEKIALLIANGRCGAAKELKLALNDVVTLTEKFVAMDFKVVALCNLKYVEMKKIIEIFCKTITKDSYVVFYFAGHGMQLWEQTYLLPVDASFDFDIMKPETILRTMMPEDFIVDCIQKGSPALNVTILDGCRRMPENAERIVPRNNQCHYQPVLKGNMVHVCSTGPYCPALEINWDKNGCFVKHLKELIMKAETFQNIVMEVQENFQSDPVTKGCQFPVLKSDLTERRTLRDSVVDNNNHSVFDNTLSWAKPGSPVYEVWQIKISKPLLCIDIEFHQHRNTFCNAMDIFIYFYIDEDTELDSVKQLEVLVEFDRMQTISESLKTEYTVGKCCHNVFTVLDLQKCKIKDILQGRVTIRHAEEGKDMGTVELELPSPNISRFKLTEE